jgi:hypothetical protein
MIRKSDTPSLNSRERIKKNLAPDPSDMVAFRQYTKQVWSKVAGRPVSDEQTEQILADFGRFLDALMNGNGEQS